LSDPTSPPPCPYVLQVKTYFNTDGFNRWKKIYGETDEVNKVQLDIRQGHAQTVEKVLGWLDAEGGLKGTTVCDAGCGTGAPTAAGLGLGWCNEDGLALVLCALDAGHNPVGCSVCWDTS
jgi:2-polyprenyl-3-methyl-5-hydroxy-6-metoxy-1,4-benzoquinol methylase